MLISSITTFSYHHTLHSPFIFDDIQNICDNPYIQITSLSPDELVHKVFSELQPITTRPVANLTFALNYYAGGYNLVGYHLVNIFIHLFNGILVFFLFIKYLDLNKPPARRLASINLAALGALLWVANPIQINAVTYIVQRMTSLSVLFTLLAFLCYLGARNIQQKTPKSTQHYHFKVSILFLTGILCWFLALLSKELAAILPILLFFHEIYFIDRFSWQHIRKKIFYYCIALFIPICIGILYYGTQLFTIFSKILGGYQYRDFTLFERLLTEPRVVFHYISLFLYPISSRFSFYSNFPISHSLFDPLTTLWATIGTILWLGGIYYWSRKLPLFSFGLLWVFVTLCIESTVIPLEIIHEHRFYFPSIGLVLCIIALARMIAEKAQQTLWKNIIYVFLIIFVAVEVLGTYSRNLDWKDDITFHEVEVKRNPESYRAHLTLAWIYNKHGMHQYALYHLKKSIEISPDNINTVANMYMFTSEMPESMTHESATKWLERSIQIVQTGQLYPTSSRTLISLAQRLYAKGLLNESLLFMEAANKISYSPGILTDVLVLLIETGKFEEALKRIEQAQESGMENQYHLYLRAICLHELGRNIEAKTTLKTLGKKTTNDKKLQADIKKLLRALELNKK